MPSRGSNTELNVSDVAVGDPCLQMARGVRAFSFSVSFLKVVICSLYGLSMNKLRDNNCLTEANAYWLIYSSSPQGEQLTPFLGGRCN